MNANEIEVHHLDVAAIKVFVGRSREKAGFDQIKASMKAMGLKVPIQVRDIRDWPAKERGPFKYELICGQGRLEAARQLKWPKIPALIVKAEEAEIVGRFLAENMIRKPLPWAEKARLIKADLDSGRTVEDVAKAFFITPAHVEKCRRILSKSAPELDDEIAAMPMNDAEVLTTLPKDEQAIVVGVLRESGAVDGNVQAVVAKAKAVKAETGTLSPLALKKSLQRVDEELKSVQDRLKPVRLHHALAVGNLHTLLANLKFKSALKKAGVSTARFEELTK